MDQTLVATLGTFDGIHRGHQQLLAELLHWAAELGARSLVLSFDPQPVEVLRPDHAPGHLLPSAENLQLLQHSGVDEVQLIPFTHELAARSASDFLQHLRSHYGVTHLLLGYDNRFGSDGRQLALEDFERLALELGITLRRATALSLPATGLVSSSATRAAITAGDLERAALLLGRPHSCSGTVVSGQKLGRKLGFPTANLQRLDEQQLLPPAGVYTCHVRSLDEDTQPTIDHGGMLYLGSRPTLGGKLEPSIEAHLFDFDADIYGRGIRIELLTRLTGERKFASLDELKEALGRYALEAQSYLRTQTEHSKQTAQ